MPYLNCPSCGMAVYSAAAWSTADDCPRCLARLRVRAPYARADRPARLIASVQEVLAARAPSDRGGPVATPTRRS